MIASVIAAALTWWLRPRAPMPSQAARAVRPAADRVLPPSLRRHRRGEHKGSDDPVTAAFERGVAAYNADDVETAMDAFEEAVRLAPDERESHINLGLVYLRLQRPEDAMRELAIGASLSKHHRRGR